MEAAAHREVEARAAAVEVELRGAQEAQLLGLIKSWRYERTLEEHHEVGLQWLEHGAISALDVMTPAGVAAEGVLQVTWEKIQELKVTVEAAEQRAPVWRVATHREARIAKAVMQWRGRQQCTADSVARHT